MADLKLAGDIKRRACRYILVIVGSLLIGASLFVLSFLSLDWVWTRFVVGNPENFSKADGVVVIGGGLVLGTILGVSGLVSVLFLFWPERIPR